MHNDGSFLLPLLLLLLLLLLSAVVAHGRLISDGGLHLQPPVLLRLKPSGTASSSCDLTYGFMPCATTTLGNLFLMLVYGYIMYRGATFLNRGSNLFLQILQPGIFGGVFLPILLELPGVMLSLASGLVGDIDSVQTQVSVGMGLLAGSTVFLLTVIWGTCVVVGKCDLEDGVAIDEQDTMTFSLTGSGVRTDDSTNCAARIMAVSAVPFLLAQLPPVMSSTSGSHWAILIALVVSLLLLISYCVYQVFWHGIQQTRIDHSLLDDQRDEMIEAIEYPLRASMKAALLLLLGTFLAAAIADPLVVAVDNFSEATSTPRFFISFIVLPLASNSELITGILLASQKTSRSASLTFSQLYGLAVMQNLLSLSVLLALVYFRDLTWAFSAEVLVNFVVCLLMGAFASFRTTYPLWTSLVAFLLYPFSLALVYVLHYIVRWS